MAILNKKLSTLLCLAAFYISIASCQQKDDTLTDYATGKDVTEATIRKITNSQIFPDDHSFLIRLAYIETRFGCENSTFRANYTGGIWQVDEHVYNATKVPALTPLHQEIETKFNIDWMTTTWESCLAPMYSALAASLYFAQITPQIPDTIGRQADHWKRFYRPEGDVSKFRADSEELRNDTVCRGKMDFAIALDGSGSIGSSNFQIAKDFVSDLITSFTLDFTRLGMLVYSDSTKDIFELETNLTIAEMATLVNQYNYTAGGTSTDLAILRGIKMHKDATRIDATPQILAVFTDGGNTGPDLPGAVAALEKSGIIPIAVGIGTGINYQELKFIALNDTRRVFTLSDFEALHDFLFDLRSITCDIPQKPVVNETYDDALVAEEKRLYEIPIPDTGITINLDVAAGQVIGYWSRIERVPNSAVHDGIIDGMTYIPAAGRKMTVYQSLYDEDTPTVFISIQGVEATNNYTFKSSEGNQVPSTDPTTEPTTTESPTQPPITTEPPTEPPTTYSAATTTTITSARLVVFGFLIIGVFQMKSQIF